MTFERLFKEIRSFFGSGVFYILVGSAFLYVAYNISLSNTAHSAFVFLVAILGVAIVLYGTGTHAAGSGSSGTVKVAIAGGAGVLAIVLGVGVLEYDEKIGRVFKRDLDYGLLRLQVARESSGGATTDLERFDIHAKDGLRPLHLLKQDQFVEILVPMNETRRNEVEVRLVNKDPAWDVVAESSLDYPISWDDEYVERTAGFTNEIVLAVEKSLDLAKTDDLPVTVKTEDGDEVAGLQITPQ